MAVTSTLMAMQPVGGRLTRRERRELDALGRLLATQDPSLAEKLSGPAVRRRAVWAARLGSVMLVFGVVMLAAGLFFDSRGVGVLGAVLLLTCWMPARIAAADPSASS